MKEKEIGVRKTKRREGRGEDGERRGEREMERINLGKCERGEEERRGKKK